MVQSWKQVASNFQTARADIARELQVQALLSADIADALGLQSEAAVMRAEADKIEKKGDALGSSDLGAIGEKSASTNDLIREKLSSAEELTAEQTAALGEAAAKYVPSLLSNIATAIVVKDTISAISDLGTQVSKMEEVPFQLLKISQGWAGDCQANGKFSKTGFSR